jgi:hypothetical protein
MLNQIKPFFLSTNSPQQSKDNKVQGASCQLREGCKFSFISFIKLFLWYPVNSADGRRLASRRIPFAEG